MTRLESFLKTIETVFRSYFLNISFTYSMADHQAVESYDVVLSPVENAEDSRAMSVLTITEDSVNILKAPPQSYDLVGENQTFNSYNLVRLFFLRALYFSISTSVSLGFYEFLSRVFDSRIDSPADLIEHILKTSEVEYDRNGETIYIYDFGSIEALKGSITLFSDSSIKTRYVIDSETSAFASVALIMDQVSATTSTEGEGLLKLFPAEEVTGTATETTDEAIDNSMSMDPSMDFGGGDGDMDMGGGDFGGDMDFGGFDDLGGGDDLGGDMDFGGDTEDLV